MPGIISTGTAALDITPAQWTLASQEVYFYGVDGKRLGTYSVALPNNLVATELFVYFGQKMVGKSFSPYQVTSFVPFVGNRLGSNGDYYPYGQDKGTPLPNDEVKFATYTRDSATGLDYAMNRYYANSLGRFTSPDPYANGGRMSDPQSWNLYAYTGGDPVNRNDPSGTDWCEEEENGPLCFFGLPFSSIPSGGPILSIPGIPGPCWTGPNYSTFVPDPGCAAFTAGIALLQNVAAHTPKPKYLQVTRDCYKVPTNGGPVTREIDYELADDSTPPQFYRGGIVWEHLQGDLPLCGANCPSSDSPGTFDDEQSVVNFSGVTTMNVTQTFSVVIGTGADVPVFVRGFGKDYSVLNIVKTVGAIYINGNAGGKVDPKSGKLISGTYKECP